MTLRNVFWYSLGGSVYLLVVIGLALASRTRPEPAQVHAQRDIEKATREMHDALREVRGEEVDFEFAKPVDADITRYLDRSFDGKERLLLLKHRKITDADLAKIKNLGDRLYISFEQSKLPPGALRHLAGMTLTTLELEKSSIQDDDLGDLGRLKGVQRLYLGNTQITDKALPHVARCPGLREVHLQNTAITDAGVETLAHMPDCVVLDLEGTQVNGTGFTAFPEQTPLKEVGLKRAAVTDDTLPALLRLKLERLDLEETKVSDVGLARITGTFPRLLMLRDTRVSERGAKELEKRCPTISVHGTGPQDPAEAEMERTRKRVDDIMKGLPR